jgi:branched-chain amino acid transport system ATP-binding protein
MTPSILTVNNIEVIYDHVILVLKGVSLNVPRGKIVALMGANGAGKSTTLKSISTLLRGERGDVTKGNIEFNGERIDQLTQCFGQTRLVASDGRASLLWPPVD